MSRSKGAAPPHEAVSVQPRQMDQRFPRSRDEGTKIDQCGKQLRRGCSRSRDRESSHAVTYGYNSLALRARGATYRFSISSKRDAVEGCTVVSVPREIDGNRLVTSAFEDRHHAFPAPCPVPRSMDKQVSRHLSCHLTAGRSAAGPAARDRSERPSSNAKHYHGTIGKCDGPVSCSALILIQAPSCAYPQAGRLDGRTNFHPHRREP